MSRAPSGTSHPRLLILNEKRLFVQQGGCYDNPRAEIDDSSISGGAYLNGEKSDI
jgi:hypothetical protein